MSYIIDNNELVAETEHFCKSGEQVRYAYTAVSDMFERTNLVNAKFGKISNAKKWSRAAMGGFRSLAECISEDGIYRDFLCL